MPQIVLTDEQATVVATAAEPILVRDRGGKVFGVLPPPWGDADIAEAKRRQASGEPRQTTDEVLARLRNDVSFTPVL
ncbi:MAG: hypothetical protein U0746_11455 [Gemmataceae bacterium]